jgi:dTDP-4-dehydrorhamnose reductase
LTGASGLVGAAFARVAANAGHRVVGIIGGFSGDIVGLAEQCAVDLTDDAATQRAVRDVGPGAIVNCAATSVPEACEADPVRSELLNVALPARLARLAGQLNARLIHLSSEQAFDGTRTTPYRVSDATSPINLYARQKLASERVVSEVAGKLGATVRAPLLMGNSPGGQRSVHERLLGDWAAGRVPRLFVDEFRQTGTADSLAAVLLELAARRDLSGVFHWAGADLLSRHDLGVRIREHFRLPESVAPIAAVRRAELPEAAAKRQACLAMDLAPLATQLTIRPETIAEQMAKLRVPDAVAAWFAQAGASPQ